MEKEEKGRKDKVEPVERAGKSVIEHFMSEIRGMQATVADMQKQFNTFKAQSMSDIKGMQATTAEMQKAFMKDVSTMKEIAKNMSAHVWGPYKPLTKVTEIL